ncbi:MAG: peptidylprolyl isomerase [Pseudomonadota bacterium]|nr:peptidylprolyl isomerase [Pseudomonadota bacterium]
MAALCLCAGSAAGQTADYIVAIVNQELVTAGEVQQRVVRLREEAARNRTPLPTESALRQQVLDALIDERVLITNARDSGAKVDDPELDRAVANVATQNQMSLPQLRERLKQDGIPYNKFRSDIRDQLLVERVREREVTSLIKTSDAEVDSVLEKRRAEIGASAEINVAQIFVTVPEGAGIEETARRRQRAYDALQRIRAGEDFAVVAGQVSEDGNKTNGGAIGMRPADRLPDVFVKAVSGLKAGETTSDLVRSQAGFHILKVLERKEPDAFVAQQTRARHILLRPSAELSTEAATRRLAELKRSIVAGTRTFEQVARANSEDASAAQGGDLGWSSPGTFVPEFEAQIDALPIGGISNPFVTRFGVHVVQVVDRRQTSLDKKQQREQARNILREQKFEQAYTDWLRDLRGRAYIEMREPPA